MKDINKYRRIYHIFTTPLVFIFLWYIILDIEPHFLSISTIKYHIIISGSLLLISLLLKKFKNIITILLIGFTGISTLILIYEDNIVFGIAFYSLAFSILSADAVYSQSGFFRRLSMFIVILFVFSIVLILINRVNPYDKSDVFVLIDSKAVPSDNSATEKQALPQQDSDATNTKNEEDINIKYDLKELERSKIKEEIYSFINKWETAWELKDSKKYKTFYSSDYIYTDAKGNKYSYNERMKYWENRFKKIKYIDVNISDIIFEFDDEYPKEVTVKMIQEYRSDSYSDRGIKTLMIFKGKSTNNEWKIYREKFEDIKQKNVPAVNKKQTEESSGFNWCLGAIILVVIVIIVAFIRKLME